MAKSFNQKLKLLYLMDMLLNKTDEDHPLTMDQIILELNKRGISAERKSIYDDIEALRLYGLDICLNRYKPYGYYVGCRMFELPELKLLVDGVQSSKFITEKKTMTLIKKLESLCSIYDAELMQRQVYVYNRIKNMNESIYYTIDKIHNGIARNRKIAFQYFEYTVTKERLYRHDGKEYCISPFSLVWDHENYYMIGFDSEVQMFKHYRVDRMDNIETTGVSREGSEQFKKLDMAVYTKKNFSMFGGEEQMVTIQFSNHLIGMVLDRFGENISILKADDEHFSIRQPVNVSPQFFAWIFALKGDAKILSPDCVIKEMKEHVSKVAKVLNEY